MNGPGPVGLFGGSFNPPHVGHRALVLHAKKRLGLKRVRVLVSPQSPLKSAGSYSTLEERLAATKKVMRGLRHVSVEAEAETGPVFAVETVERALKEAPGVPLVYLMGADSFAQFHRWHAWEEIMSAVPIAVVNRPGERLSAIKGPAGLRYAAARLPERVAERLPFARAPAWCFLTGLSESISSTEIRSSEKHL